MSDSNPPSPKTTSSTETPSPHISSFFSHLPIWARAGLVIACLLVSIFIVSTTIVCIVRRGRLTTTTSRRRRRSKIPMGRSSVGYRAPEKGPTHSEVEFDDDEEGGSQKPASPGGGGFSRPLTALEALAQKRGRNADEEHALDQRGDTEYRP